MHVITAIALISLAVVLTVMCFKREDGAVMFFLWLLAFWSFQAGAKWQRDDVDKNYHLVKKP